MNTPIAVLEKVWEEFISDPENLKDMYLGFDRGFDKSELYRHAERSESENIKYRLYFRRDYYHWLDKTLLCPMCNARTNYLTIFSPFYQRHLNNDRPRRICFYSGHSTNKHINDAELTVSQVACLLGRSDSWVLSLIKYGIIKAHVWGNMYIIESKNIGNINDMKIVLKEARKNNLPRVNYINCHAERTYLSNEQINEFNQYKLMRNHLSMLNSLHKDHKKQSTYDETIERLINSYYVPLKSIRIFNTRTPINDP